MAELPPGFTLDVPTGLPPGFALDAEPKKDNFFERFGDDLKSRFGEQGAEIIKRHVDGDQGFKSTALQLVGQVGAGSIMDFLGEVLISGGRGLSNITPDFIEDPLKESATKAGMALLNTDLGQRGLNAAKDGIQAWQEFAEEHPVMAANIGAVVNIALLASPVKAKPKAPSVGALTRAGQKLEKSAEKATAQNKENFVKELVTPSQTKKVREAQTSRTTEKGILRNKQVELSASEKASAAEILKLKGVSSSLTNQGNLNVIAKAVTKEADKLQKGLAGLGNKGKYLEQEIDDALESVLTTIKTQPTVQGNALKATEDMIAGMKRFAADNPRTLSGLLKARKEFDQWITQGKGSKFFDSDLQNALQAGVRATRQEINNFVSVRAPSQGVRKSLDKQFRLLNAIDDIAVKAAAEGNNRVIRGFRNALKILPFRGEFNQFLAAIFGIGGLGASAKFAPYFTKLVGLTGVAYVGGKAITRPGSRKGLAGLLTMIDRAIQKTTDPAVIRQFRIDRAAVVELLESSEEAIENDT